MRYAFLSVLFVCVYSNLFNVYGPCIRQKDEKIDLQRFFSVAVYRSLHLVGMRLL